MTNWQEKIAERQQVLEREKFLTIGVFDPHGQSPSFIYVDQDLELDFSLMMVGINPRMAHLIITETRKALLAQGIARRSNCPSACCCRGWRTCPPTSWPRPRTSEPGPSTMAARCSNSSGRTVRGAFPGTPR